MNISIIRAAVTGKAGDMINCLNNLTDSMIELQQNIAKLHVLDNNIMEEIMGTGKSVNESD